jgi:large subunit ribosomal protein L25
MAEMVTFTTQPRDKYGTSVARNLRKKGLIPAVLYGHKEKTVALTLPGEDLEKALRHGIHVVDLKVDDNTEKALVREVQWDHLGKSVLHVDFTRVSEDERVVVTVPLEIRGTAAGIAEGGVLDQPVHSLEVECQAISVPASIRVNVAELKLGQALHIRDVVLPPGVIAKGNPDTVVVHVALKQLVEEPVVAPAAPEAAEPEVIGKPKEEEPEAEKK